MKLIERLKLRHARLEHELAVEQARRLPDEERVARLKKLKLAVKDRMQALLPNPGRHPLPA
ncbi:YdcH family protein [Sandaracinobacter sp. RS1-74]|uniref:YdcH family protein n=1 Tax=Sandaracinobacteroides sayramensis TaxID=2913411 RepID=UPI001ED9D3C5|nr:YdcH family protein [Sandaracinobacteroides sayramensis]MCG2839973.1 YdcH family protein [Sandaracinobacteroides sayramensis]